MASSLLKNLSLPKSLNVDNILKILVVVIVIGAIYYFWNMSSGMKLEAKAPMVTQQQMSVRSDPAPVDQTSMTSNTSFTEGAPLSGADLLPRDSNSEWNNLNLERNASGVVMPDMLQAGVHQGLDTVGSVLRNANQQIRPDPVIPKTNTGLCNVNMSTIEPDQMMGGCDKTLC